MTLTRSGAVLSAMNVPYVSIAFLFSVSVITSL